VLVASSCILPACHPDCEPCERPGVNAFDKKGLYNFQSVFGGTHVIPPRTIAGRIRYVF